MPYVNELIERLNGKISNIKSIVQNINDKDTNLVMGQECINLYGSNYICDYIRKVVVPSFQSQYSNGSFTPVDPLKYCSDVSAIKKNSKRKSP